MKKITTFLALLLTCIIGATAADFVPTAGTKYLIKCKGNSKYVLWNSSCVKSATDNKVILSNWLQFDSRSLFSIEGDATTGYTIRSVKDNTQYVYAINTNDDDGNVGVKAVTETPGDECVWKIVAQGDGWNIIPKNGSYSWNNRGSYNGNAHVGMWNSNASADDIWYIKPVDDVVYEIVAGLNDITIGTDLGLFSTSYKNSVNTNATAYKTSQSEEALANLGALAVNKISYINLPTGYYRLKSCQTDGNGENNSVFDGTYLFTDIVNYPNVSKTLANVPLDEAKAKNNYVWKITRGELPSATVGIVNGQGKGVNNGTNYNTINLGLSDYYSTGAIYFTQGLHITNQGIYTVGGADKNKNASAEATRSNPFTMTGWNHSDSKGSAYIFEPVSMEGVTAYTVNVTGADQGSVTLNSTNEVAMNGGFFLLSSAPQVADLTAKTLDGYDVAVTVAENSINVSYAHNYAYAKAEAEAAIAKKGVGYPTAAAAARVTLNKAIADAAAAEPNIATAATLLEAVDAYEKNKTEIQMPEDGKAYVITNIHKTGGKRYMKYQADGTSMIARDDATVLPIEATYICHKVDGKYVFANNSGTYLTWRGNATGDCTNDNKGFTTSYDADYNTFTVAANPDVFGCLSFGAKRDGNTNKSYYIVTKTGAFGKAGFDNSYNDNYSSAFTFEEVAYPNTITFHDAQNINGVSHIATFSAPFATIIPAGVKAYYVSAKGTEATMTAIEAEAIPANQGVILTSESGEAATMVPAASETAATITGNQLGNSAGNTRSLTAGEGYILGNGSEGTAFYPCQAGSLPINKAYLLGNGESSAIVMNFGNAVTGINTIAAPASAKAPIFDLSGRRVVKATKGLYIQNGKKVIVK